MVRWTHDSAGTESRWPRIVKVLKAEEEEFWLDIPGADVRVCTSDGRSIPAHSGVLASSSPVLESLVNKKRLSSGGGEKKGRRIFVPLHGVPHSAVVSFLRCLYDNAGFSRCPQSTDEPVSEPQEGRSPTPQAANETAKHGVHLLVLSHSLQIQWLKRSSASALSSSLTLDNVVDMFQLARMCDAPELQVHCMALIRRQFKAVQRTEGWRFLQRNDARLELGVLQWIEDDERSDRIRRKLIRDNGVYAELGEAVECLEHICCKGCHLVKPKDQRQQHQHGNDNQMPGQHCAYGQMCIGLQQLILHFATCDRKKKARSGAACGCGRCTRMWQLLRLHSAVCSRSAVDEFCCKVPLCKQFKEKATNGDSDEMNSADRWQLLARKVGSAKAILTASKKKKEQGPPEELDQSD